MLSPTLVTPQIYQFIGNKWDQEPGYTTKPGCNHQNAEYNKFSKANKKISSTKSKGEGKKKKKGVGREPKIKETLETILIYGPYLKPVQINKL